MEIEYKLIPSLERRVLVYIATVLWNQKDIRNLISEFLFSHSFLILEFWKEIEDKVYLKTTHLLLPRRLKKAVSRIIKPVGMQIFNWMMYHKVIYSCVRRLPEEFCWTAQGTIEQRETAKLLINDGNLDLIDRYTIACLYCLEKDIPKIWSQIPTEYQEQLTGTFDIQDIGRYIYNQSFAQQPKLVYFWSIKMGSELVKFETWLENKYFSISCDLPLGHALECAVLDGNEAGAKYLLRKLSMEDKQRVLLKCAQNAIAMFRIGFRNKLPFEPFANILRLLFISMNEEQQIKMCQNYCFYILNCFLIYPWQDYFLITAIRNWTFLCARAFYNLLWIIIDKIYTGYKDYNYWLLFVEFWQQGPSSFRKYSINHCTRNGGLLQRLFKLRNKENIKLILMEASSMEKEKLIFQKNGRDICGILIINNKWSLLKFFLQECLTSKEVVIIFKECYLKKGFFGFVCAKELEKRKDKLSRLLDHLIQKIPKTSLEEDYHLAVKYNELELNGIYLGSDVVEDTSEAKAVDHICSSCYDIELI